MGAGSYHKKGKKGGMFSSAMGDMKGSDMMKKMSKKKKMKKSKKKK
jgi:hypothetical protein